jgi:sodium/bile acid cotransporter 7
LHRTQIVSSTTLVLSGFALRIEQLSAAASNGKFNAFVICFNFLGISCVVNFVAKFFYVNEIVSEDLMKGMIICSCLSMPTNMMVVLAVASKGDEAIALFIATVMNLMGVFVTPLLIFFYLQENAEIDFINTYKTISLRVILPVAAGIWVRRKAQGADEFAIEHKKRFLKIRERCLVYVVYATFCTTFMTGTDSTNSQICIMAISQVILLASAMFIAWIALFIFFNRMPKLRVVGLYGCSTKTAALGIPLISAIYEDSPKLGIYTLPLLIWYPSQLIIGTMLAPRMSRFVEYKINKYETERSMRQFDNSKGCGLLQQPIEF